MSDSSDRAKTFAALHAGPSLLILPNAWDAGSARVIAHAGAKAIATSSAAVAWAHGYPDGEALPEEVVLANIREIARVVDVPVSADIEAAYAHDATAASNFVARVIEAGAVGINVEDGTEPPDLLAGKIEAIAGTGRRLGVAVWINARVDVYLKKLAEGDAAYAESVRRARLYREAGANSIFVPGVAAEETIGKLVRDVVLPLNLLAWPGLPPAQKLTQLGVRRLSAGSSLAKSALGYAHAAAQAFLAEGRSEPFAGGPLASVNLNALMKRG
jgi:2-methylisocitrate lyase-like PEP mutase family enzyme